MITPVRFWRICILLFIVAAPTFCTAVRSESSPPWLLDRGNGTYQNPVLFADYSDPDAIRVGDDFYLISSSFMAAPGFPILHSRDLVNWTIINHVFAQQTPVEHFAKPRHGKGVWAPAIRHHAGEILDHLSRSGFRDLPHDRERSSVRMDRARID